MTSLLEYAEKNPGKSTKCNICQLPPDILAEVNGALRVGLGPAVICDWLWDDKQIKRHARLVQYHSGQRHHEEDA